MPKLNYNELDNKLRSSENFDETLKGIVDTYFKGTIDTDFLTMSILKNWYEISGNTLKNPMTNYISKAKDLGLNLDYNILSVVNDKVVDNVLTKRDVDPDNPISIKLGEKNKRNVSNGLLLNKDFINKSVADAQYYIDIYQFLSNKDELDKLNAALGKKIAYGTGFGNKVISKIPDITIAGVTKPWKEWIDGTTLRDFVIYKDYDGKKESLRSAQEVRNILGELAKARDLSSPEAKNNANKEQSNQSNKDNINYAFKNKTDLERFFMKLGLDKTGAEALKQYFSSPNRFTKGY